MIYFFKLRFQSHKDKFIKRDIQVFSDQSNFNFDINNLPISKPIPSKSFIQRPKSEITYLLPKVFNEKKLIENNLQLSFQKKTQTSDYHQRFSKFDFKSDPLTYPEVLDTYSLHHFIIRKGKTLSETPEFQSYKRICEKIWEPIERIIKELEKLIKDNNIFLINVDGKKVARLAVEKRFHSTEDLLDCFVNQDELQKKIKIPKRLFKGIDGKEKACVKIQSLWKMYINLRDYKRIKVLIEKVKIIQKGFRSFQNFKKTKELIKEKNQKEFEIYLEKMENFKKNWNTIKLKKRVEIHINSCSFEVISLNINKNIFRK